MEHWLDHFSKRLALSATAPLPLTQAAPSEPAGGGCTVRYARGATTFDYAIRSRFNGRPFVLESSTTLSRPTGPTPFPSGPGMKSSLRLTLGGVSVLDIQRQFGAVSTRVDVNYGSAFSGIRSATFSAAGDTLSGVVDGRRTLPLPIHADIHQLRFEDGKPEPHVGIDGPLREAIACILKQSGETAKTCVAKSPAQETAMLYGSVRTIIPFTVGGVKCTNCIDTCDSAQEWCSGLITAGCLVFLFGEGACEAAGLAACAASWLTCNQGCDNPGGDCCPVYCNQRERCCDDNATCDGVGECCPAGQMVCGGTCCPAGISACNEGICCPAQQKVCSGVCCAPGQNCSNEGICCAGTNPVSCQGVCCASGDVCTENKCCPPGEPVCNGVCCPGGGCDTNGNCCAPPNHFCAGSELCCPPFNVCCGSVCCDTNAICVNGTCCPQEQSCGGVCCPAGTICLNAATHTCGGCPPGTASCLPPGTNKPVCCPPGQDCCNNVCCAPGDRCCPRAGGFACVHESCIH